MAVSGGWLIGWVAVHALAVAALSAAPASAQLDGVEQPTLDTLACDLEGVSRPQSASTVPAGPAAPLQPPFLGFNEDAVAGVHGVAPVDYVGLVQTIGGNVLRTNIDWRNAEPQRDCWDEAWWSEWRDLYSVAVARGVRPVFIIGAAPGWAREATRAQRECKGYAGCAFPPTRQMDAEWSEFASEVAARFPQAMLEVWNEPNLGSMWSPTPDPERWAELVVLAYDAIKSTSADTTVVAGGLLGIRRTKGGGAELAMREFLARAYAAVPSIAGHYDYLALHPYTTRGRIGRKSAFRRALRDMRAIRERNRDHTPIFVTEFGISTHSRGIDEERQTKKLNRIHNRLAAAPDIAGTIYHRVIEPKDTTQDPLEIGYAWLRHGMTPPEPRPVYCHFADRAGNTYPGC